MKKMWYLKFLLFLLFLPGSLLFTSCVDESVDLKNLSKDILWDGEIQIPVAKSKITMIDLIDEYGRNTDDEAVFDTVFIEDGKPGLIALYYEKNFPYSSSEKSINGGFDKLKFDMQALEFVIDVTGTIQVSGPIKLNDHILAPAGDAHFIEKLELEGADVSITPINGVKLKTVRIGNKTVNVNGKWTFDLGNVIIQKEDELVVDCDYEVGALVPDKIEMTITPDDYIVWGWFNYRFYDVKKSDPFDTNISQYLENSNFMFCDPQFEFTIDNNNVGVPLILNLRNIIVNEEESNVNNLAVKGDDGNGYPFSIAYPTQLNGNVNSSFYNIKKSESGKYNFSSNQYSTLVGTYLKRVSAVYDLITDSKKYESDRNNLSKIQFISSKGGINVNVKAILPFWINKGLLEYTHTISIGDTDFGKDEDYELQDNVTVTLQFNYQNHLPFDMHVIASLLDEDGRVLLQKEPIDGKGFMKGKVENMYVTGATSGTLEIELNKAEYDILRNKAKDLKLLYRSDETSNVEIRTRTTDYLDVKVSAVVKGAVIIKDNK